MNILIAPDKFKNSLSAQEITRLFQACFQALDPTIRCTLFPLADGGDGTTEIFLHHKGGKKITVTVDDPLFRPRAAWYVLSHDEKTAFMEMANASGLQLLKPEERRVMETTTLGTGQMIADALDRGVEKIVMGIGGSGTNDGGIGALTALGFVFLDDIGRPLNPIGSSLTKIKKIDITNIHPGLKELSLTAICDVDNPLVGMHGAAFVYGPQKGGTPEELIILNQGLENFAARVQETSNKEIAHLPGAGAGGGIAGGIVGLMDGVLKKGIDAIFEMTAFEEKVRMTDWIITGEGRIDNQTLYGKVVSGVSVMAKKHNKKIIVVAGKNELSMQVLKNMGLEVVFCLTDIADESVAMEEGEKILKELIHSQIYPFLKRQIEKKDWSR